MRFFSKDLISLRLFENKKKTMNDTSYSWIEIKVIDMQLSH